jgi:hypothetical protein
MSWCKLYQNLLIRQILVLPMGVEPTTAILETAALPLSYGSMWRHCSNTFYQRFQFYNFDGPKVAGYRSKIKGWLLTVREPLDASPV